jgi:hypothetical protein
MGFNLETNDPPATSDQLETKLEELVLPEGSTAEEEAMLEEGKKAAVAIVEAGVLGATGAEGDFYGVAFASISNPGHAVPEEGPNDRLTIEVRKVSDDWPPEAPAEQEAPVEEEEPVPA